MIEPMRVIVVDDHYLVREGTRRLLESSGVVDVVATLPDALQLDEAVTHLRPDSVIVDIRMPPGHQMEGIDAAHQIRATHPGVGVVVLSQHASPLYAFELFKKGTAGLAYLLKDRVGDLDELLRALREVTSGGSVVDPVVVEGLLGREQSSRGTLLGELSVREREVLQAMAEGRSNAAIAQGLFLSKSAVEKHINAIFAKLALPADEHATHRRVAAVLTFLRARGVEN
ncbi:response regulator transcription factor [Isoptericola croceus]|uniref:response regulator transcription factor n=1 Tax=Isoptericola croceus TaxID=3031406 RepID=UPI0023F647A3|nr:response regulator transcription factor [Isoptericola croceus]